MTLPDGKKVVSGSSGDIDFSRNFHSFICLMCSFTFTWNLSFDRFGTEHLHSELRLLRDVSRTDIDTFFSWKSFFFGFKFQVSSFCDFHDTFLVSSFQKLGAVADFCPGLGRLELVRRCAVAEEAVSLQSSVCAVSDVGCAMLHL